MEHDSAQKPNYFFAYIARICRYLSFGKLDWKNAKKRNAELVALTDEMELCIPNPASKIDEEPNQRGDWAALK